MRIPFLVMSAKLFGYFLTMLWQTVWHWERVGLVLYFLISSTSTSIIWRRHLGDLLPFVMAESISWGILSHGTSNTSGHMSCGGTPFGSGCGDELEQEGEPVRESELDENEELG